MTIHFGRIAADLPQLESAGRLMSAGTAGVKLRRMETTYGVVWQEGAASLSRGRLHVDRSGIRLDGMSGSDRVSHAISYDELSQIRIGRSPGDRIGGRPTVVLVRRAGEAIAIAAVAPAGVFSEIAERLRAIMAECEGSRTT